MNRFLFCQLSILVNKKNYRKEYNKSPLKGLFKHKWQIFGGLGRIVLHLSQPLSPLSKPPIKTTVTLTPYIFPNCGEIAYFLKT